MTGCQEANLSIKNRSWRGMELIFRFESYVTRKFLEKKRNNISLLLNNIDETKTNKIQMYIPAYDGSD